MLAECCLWLVGERPGSLSGDLFPVNEVVVQPLFVADSNGINSYDNQSEIISEEYQLNSQGFRSKVEYDALAIDSLRVSNGKKVVMLVGDSYTEG